MANTEELKVKQELDVDHQSTEHSNMFTTIKTEPVDLETHEPGPSEPVTEENESCETIVVKIEPVEVDIKIEPTEMLENYPQVCSECGEIFPNKSVLDQHKLYCTVSREVSNEAARVLASTHNTKTGPKKRGGKRHQCPQCSYITSRKNNFVEHMKTHTGDRPFKCSQCEYCASRKSSLTDHMRTHTGDKPYKCYLCEHSFRQNSGLLRHLKIHSGDKPFKCPYCEYCASRKNRLEGHMRVHTGDKPFKCHFKCHYSSAHKGGLIRHLKTHSGDRPYKCTLCDYTAFQKGNLLSHMDMHPEQI